MNWYKKAQPIEIIDQRGTYDDPSLENKYYTQIGHSIYNRKNPLEKTNIMWVLINGNIDTEKVNFGTTHGSVSRWSNVDFEKTYAGRYSPIKKIITIIPPSEGIRQYRAVPIGISSLLKMKFPDAQQIYVF